MKHFKQLTFIILTLSLLLCGCGGTETNTNGNTNNNTTNSAGKNEEYTLSEFINKGETIWYATDGYGKDDKIGEIYVIEADGTLYYADCDWTLGEVEQKSDDEIVSFVKETYKKEMTASINYIMNSYHKGDRIENLDECGTIITDLSSIYTPYLENIEPATYKLSLTSDSTGNRADTEILAFKEYAPTDGDGMYTYSTQIWKIELSQIVPFESNEGATNSFNIYDSWYGANYIKIK